MFYGVFLMPTQNHNFFSLLYLRLYVHVQELFLYRGKKISILWTLFTHCLTHFYFILVSHWLWIHVLIIPYAVRRILKNFNLKKSQLKLLQQFARKTFQQLEIIFKPSNRQVRNLCHMGTYWKIKGWSFHFSPSESSSTRMI